MTETPERQPVTVQGAGEAGVRVQRAVFIQTSGEK